MTNRPSNITPTWIAAAASLIVLLTGCGGDNGDNAQVSEIRTLSNRADLVSGGDALVEIVLVTGADPAALQVQLNGTDVSSSFARRSDGRVKGVVSGLQNGVNTLTASTNGTRPVTLSITNYPKGGPIFSGPQVMPWVCMTQESGLGPAQDAQCNAPIKVEYLYRSTDAAKTPPCPEPANRCVFLPYDPSNPPADVANTTTDQGITVPFIVRRERGTMNRFIYDIAVLADPTKQVSPFNPPAAWNGKLAYTFVGGAAGQHIQGTGDSFGTLSLALHNQSGDFVSAATSLSLGYATASSSGNTFINDANPVTAAEVMMMVKERVAESLGEIRYTISQGASGGSMQQQLFATTYPGLLDGILPSASFADLYTVNNEAQDCSLLARYFDANPSLWSDVAKQNAVWQNGPSLPGQCRNNATNAAQWMNPSVGCYLGMTVPWIYDATANPTGVRCALHDYQVNLFGKRPDGFANRPYDNVGVQYGLKALNAGAITAEQFVHMNENAGGRDIDWNWTPQRSVADPFALDVVYRSGQVNLGNGLSDVPIIDLRRCANTDVHACFHSWATRERLIKANGKADNQVILYTAASDVVGAAAIAKEARTLLDRWVAAIKADTSNDSQAVKVARHRPAEATDACWINGVRTTDMAACDAAFPRFGNSRTGAGESLRVDVMKCQLRPLDRTSYGTAFTDAQWARLQAAFPGGACDWTAPSVGQAAVVPWLSYTEGPGGKPLGAPPQSH